MPLPLRAAAAWAAAIGVIAGGAFALVLLLAQVEVVVWAMVAALLISALLRLAVPAPLRRASRMLAAVPVVVGFLALLVGALWLIGDQIADQFDDLGVQLDDGLQRECATGSRTRCRSERWAGLRWVVARPP